MALGRGVLAIFALVMMSIVVLLPRTQAQASMTPAPAPTSDGTSIDQGIGYLLMAVALVLTYLIHTMDATYL